MIRKQHRNKIINWSFHSEIILSMCMISFERNIYSIGPYAQINDGSLEEKVDSWMHHEVSSKIHQTEKRSFYKRP